MHCLHPCKLDVLLVRMQPRLYRLDAYRLALVRVPAFVFCWCSSLYYVDAIVCLGFAGPISAISTQEREYIATRPVYPTGCKPRRIYCPLMTTPMNNNNGVSVRPR